MQGSACANEAADELRGGFVTVTDFEHGTVSEIGLFRENDRRHAMNSPLRSVRNGSLFGSQHRFQTCASNRSCRPRWNGRQAQEFLKIGVVAGSGGADKLLGTFPRVKTLYNQRMSSFSLKSIGLRWSLFWP
jgi:hypothetical protein